MLRVIDRRAYLGDAGRNPGRGLVVHDADRLDPVLAIRGELLGDLRRIDAMPPIARHKLDIEPELCRHLPPQGREMAGLEHQHPVARRQRVDERRLPGAGAGGGIDDNRPFGPEHPPHAGDDLLAELAELRAAMIDRRNGDRMQDPIGHIGRSRDL